MLTLAPGRSLLLREIRCKIFRKEVVRFHSGLNVVLGDEKATNSIGKSTLLMVVDFVFGGSTFLTWNKDVVRELGHHHYDFMFEFDGLEYRFRRETLTPDSVYACDQNYDPTTSLSLSEFNARLKKLYGLPSPKQSFRSAVGLHLRVWGKDNLIPDLPLHASPNSSGRDCVDNLIKTYGMFEPIEQSDAESKKAEKQLKTLRAAQADELIPKLTKTAYKQAGIAVANLERDLASVRESLASYAVSLETIVNREVLDLRKRKEILLARRTILAGRLQRLELNIAGRRRLGAHNFRDLQRYFPEVNVERLAEVEHFHDGVAGILQEQLLQSMEGLRQEVDAIDAEVKEIDSKVSDAMRTVDQPEALVEHIYGVARSLEEAKASRQSYELATTTKEAVQLARENLTSVKQGIVWDVQKIVNAGMLRLTATALGETRRAPELWLSETGYKFETFEDTGTGTAYLGMILFDLSVFESTKLPVIAHDSVLFKNISNDTVAKLIRQYTLVSKQSFIALDDVDRYGADAAKLLRELSVLQLSDMSVLYIKDWRPTGSTILN